MSEETQGPELYSGEEKLGMIAAGVMDPKELGMASAEEAKLQLLEKEPVLPVLQDFITFEVSEVPHAVRAHWARKDLTVIPDNQKGWEADWVEANLDSHRLQARLRCGTAMAMLDQTFTDVIPGMIHLMRLGAQMLEDQFARQNAKVVDVEAAVVTPSGNEPITDGNSAGN